MIAEISDLTKANKNHLQDLKTAHDDYSTELSALTARLQRAEDRVKDSETALEIAQQKAIKVSGLSCSILVEILYILYSG